MSSTQNIWHWLAAGDYPPPQPKRGLRYAPEAPCWLCGSDTKGVGWHLKDAIAPTFTDYAAAACLESKSVCQPCVALSQSKGWLQYVTARPERGLTSHFPQKGSKPPRQLNWLYMSHVIGPDFHFTPSRKDWRELLLSPPEPPFYMILAVLGKKQLMFKPSLNYSCERLRIQADDNALWCEPLAFKQCLIVFEALYALGFSKSSIANGNYHSAALMKCGLARWKSLDDEMKQWRQRFPEYVFLAEWCAQKPEDTVDPLSESKPIKSESKKEDSKKNDLQLQLF